MTADLEVGALERAARHLDALNMLNIRPAAAHYLPERAAKLRAGTGWEDADLLTALDEHENTPAEPRPPRVARLTVPAVACHPGCDTTICFADED